MTLVYKDCELYLDEEDLPVLSRYNWGWSKDGYLLAWVGQKSERFHRLIMGAKVGQLIDHINGNRADCRKSNLRFADYSLNNANRVKKANAKSIFKGVTPVKGRFRARLKINKQQICLGYYNSESEAALAYNRGVVQYRKDTIRLNVL